MEEPGARGSCLLMRLGARRGRGARPGQSELSQRGRPCRGRGPRGRSWWRCLGDAGDLGLRAGMQAREQGCGAWVRGGPRSPL